MSTLAQRRMTVDEFLAWAEGGWELYNGVPNRMTPERSRHSKVKLAVRLALPDVMVEVLSPLTRKLDETVKRDGYCSRPTAHDDLKVDPESPPVVHHCRLVDGAVARLTVHGGPLALALPGIELNVAAA